MRKEIISIVLLFSVLLLFISLFSYDPADPSINHALGSDRVEIHNLFGRVGAHLAGVCVGLFGLGAFWLPVLLFFAGKHYFANRSGKTLGYIMAGGALLVVATGSLMALNTDSYLIWGRSVSSGGMICIPFKSFLLEYTNKTGGVLVLILMFCIGFILTTRISIVVLAHGAVRYFTNFIATVGNGVKPAVQSNIKRVRLFKEAFVKKRLEKPAAIIPVKRRLSVSETAVAARPKPSGQGSHPLVINPPKPQESIKKEVVKILAVKGSFTLPPLSFLSDPDGNTCSFDDDNLRMKSGMLEDKLKDFGIKGEVVEISPGPVITTFEYRPAPGVKISKIVNLSDDLALALSAISIRIIAPIPGRDVIGVEIPNETRAMVRIKEIVGSKQFVNSKSRLTMCLGKDIVGMPVSASLEKMPHLLIAGATGTGKSVGLNAMIASLLFKSSPDEVKFIMVDPKRIELSVYDGIPHLITPVVTDMKKATNALFWAVREMERRYELLAGKKVRNVGQYNNLTPESEDDSLEDLPHIVVVIDELADLMMVASRDVETALTRLAQMARAAGIHLILATQRPSVDVLTGIIKANFPTRISFQVSSRIDSRTIIDANGAESLLGNGDMLFVPPGTARLQRIHGAYISEDELSRLIDYLKEQGAPEYVADVTEVPEESVDDGVEEEHDVKYDEAVAFVTKTRQASISSVQRQFRIGYNRAARIIEMMEREGIVAKSDGTSRPREVLVAGYEEIP